MRKKRCFLYAYDRQNFGDDLFVHTICERYPNAQFYMWTNKQNCRTFRELSNLRVVDQNSSLVHCLQKIRTSLIPKYRSWLENRCDAVVYIGGSIFIEYDNWKQILSWWEYEAKNRPFYVLGANFGPYKTEAYRDKLAEILKNVYDICFRDKYSSELFSDVDKVRYAPDILFNHNFPIVENKNQIFISVIDCASRNYGLDKLSDNEEKYINLLLKYINHYVKIGYNIVISSFCKIENDEHAIDRIMCKLENDVNNKINLIKYNGTNINKIISAIAESEFVIASRFHAAVLGLAANKPVLPLIYSDKTLNILQDLDFKGKYIDIRKLDENSYIEPYYIRYDHQMVKNIKPVKKKSNEHFKKLDKILI
jgi:colanic acid/amylovoran biosynthesis protein